MATRNQRTPARRSSAGGKVSTASKSASTPKSASTTAKANRTSAAGRAGHRKSDTAARQKQSMPRPQRAVISDPSGGGTVRPLPPAGGFDPLLASKRETIDLDDEAAIARAIALADDDEGDEDGDDEDGEDIDGRDDVEDVPAVKTWSTAKKPAEAKPAPKKRIEKADDHRERLQKALARAGVASRRAAEVMIAEGRVRVNDTIVKALGTKIDPARDRISVDGRVVQVTAPERQEMVYFLLNKPTGFLTTTKDDRGRRTVMDLVIGASLARIYPVGRLDFDAEGALLLTNDGELANLLTHPRYHVPKTYHAKVKGVPGEDKLDKLRRGIYLEDGPTKPAHIEIIERAKKNTWVEITVTEGRNRLIKRMFWRIQHPVLKLVRTQFGALSTEGLGVGEYREINRAELRALKDFIA